MRAACAIFFAIALPVLLSAACAETAQGPLAGASDAWARAPEPTLASATHQEPARWEGYEQVLHLPPVTTVPLVSRGHAPEQTVDVRANEIARTPYTALVTDTVFPDGSLLAELSHDANGTGYVMRKTAGAWTYFELDARGDLLASGTPALCVGCHDQAASDHVFGLPRSLSAP